MSRGLISLSSVAVKGLQLINCSDPTLLRNLVQKICERLPTDQQSLFTSQERDQIREVFRLQTNFQLDSLLSCMSELLLISTFHLFKAEELQQELEFVGLNSGALRVFTEVLFTTGKQLCDRLKSHSIAPNQLEDVRWLLNVEVANSSATRVNRPSCNLELLLSNSVTKQTDKVPIQLSHEGLSKLFQSIEEVQLQLDKL